MKLTEITSIKLQIRSLSKEQKVELLKFLANDLKSETLASRPLEYGKYAGSGRAMATEDDFKFAEWNLLRTL
jgi:hypothetical protein